MTLRTELDQLLDRAATAYRDAVQARAYAEETERRLGTLVRELEALARQAEALEPDGVGVVAPG